MRVHEYVDTRQFIVQSFERSKEGNSALTIERYAKRLGLGGSSLKMIMSGKRRPTVHQTLAIARGLRLSSEDTAYLETLTLREAAPDKWQKAYYSKKLSEKKKESRLSTFQTSQQELLADPIVLPLLVYFMESKGTDINYSKIAKDLRVSEERVKQLISDFKKNEVLRSQPDGRFHVAFDKLSHRLQQKKYQKAVLNEASNRMESEYDSATSLFVSYSFAATDETLLKLQMDLKNLMAKYMGEEIDDSDGKHIAQACFQIFSMIRP
jgi:uncharacterized protein (TIGR02147 family)